VGAGLRYVVGTHISFRFDYGWQLTNKDLSRDIKASDSRAHIGLLVSF
jgi:hypothetical protein